MMGMVLGLLPVLLSFGAIDALVPLLIVIVLIAAAASLNRGWNALKIFGLDTILTVAGYVGTRGSLKQKSAFSGGRSPGQSYSKQGGMFSKLKAAKLGGQKALGNIAMDRAGKLSAQAKEARENTQGVRKTGGEMSNQTSNPYAREREEKARKLEARAQTYRSIGLVTGAAKPEKGETPSKYVKMATFAVSPLETAKGWKQGRANAKRAEKEAGKLKKNLENIGAYGATKESVVGRAMTPSRVKDILSTDQQADKLGVDTVDALRRKYYGMEISESNKAAIEAKALQDASGKLTELAAKNTLRQAAAQLEGENKTKRISDLVDQYTNRAKYANDENSVFSNKSLEGAVAAFREKYSESVHNALDYNYVPSENAYTAKFGDKEVRMYPVTVEGANSRKLANILELPPMPNDLRGLVESAIAVIAAAPVLPAYYVAHLVSRKLTKNQMEEQKAPLVKGK